MSKGDILTEENTHINTLYDFMWDTECKLCFTADCWGCIGKRTCQCECNGMERDEEYIK